MSMIPFDDILAELTPEQRAAIQRRYEELRATIDPKPAGAAPLSDNPQPLSDKLGLSDKGAVPLPDDIAEIASDEGPLACAELHLRMTTLGCPEVDDGSLADGLLDARRDLKAYGDAREAAAVTDLKQTLVAIERENIEGWKQAAYWREKSEAAGRADAVPVSEALAIMQRAIDVADDHRMSEPRNLSIVTLRMDDANAVLSALAPAPQQMATQGEAIRAINYELWMNGDGGCEPPQDWQDGYSAAQSAEGASKETLNWITDNMSGVQVVDQVRIQAQFGRIEDSEIVTALETALRRFGSEQSTKAIKCAAGEGGKAVAVAVGRQARYLAPGPQHTPDWFQCGEDHDNTEEFEYRTISTSPSPVADAEALMQSIKPATVYGDGSRDWIVTSNHIREFARRLTGPQP